MYDLADFAMQMGPQQRQAAMANMLRGREQASALQQANQQAHSADIPAAAALMANNPALAQAAQMFSKTRQAQHKPVQMGQQGFALPSQGEFVESPMYREERDATRQARMDQIAAQQAAALQRTREAQAATLERQRERQEANAALQKTLLAMRAAGREPKSAPKGRTLATGALKDLSTKFTTASKIQDLASGFRDDFGDKSMDIIAATQNLLGKKQPFGVGEDYADQSNWWLNYNDAKNMIRHELFGSALTAPEKAAFDAANITEGMASKEIRRRLGQQKAAAQKAYNKLKDLYGKGGYDTSNLDEFQEDLAATPGGAVPTAPTNAPPAPEGIDPEDWKYMTPEERSMWQN